MENIGEEFSLFLFVFITLTITLNTSHIFKSSLGDDEEPRNDFSAKKLHGNELHGWVTHPFADGDGFLGQGLGVRHVVLHDGLEQLVFVLPVERRLDWHRQTQGRRSFSRQRGRGPRRIAPLCLTLGRNQKKNLSPPRRCR